MKVIREGDGKEFKLEMECTKCKSLLEIVEDDVKFYGGSDYPLYKPEAYYVNCPVCKAQPDIPKAETQIPPLIQQRARDKWFKKNP